ncbi:MAG: GWxTD domain-containing protein [Gemmatimonadetes bacterium]|nr:GWxTD domain-containing protein [Gemmatimonadota bacterium]
MRSTRVVAAAFLLLGSAAVPRSFAQIPAAAESAAARGDTIVADSAIATMLRRNPTSPATRLQVGRWYRRHPFAQLRARGDHYFREAARLAREQGNRALEVEAEYELGRSAWIRWEQFSHRYRLFGDVTSIDPLRTLNDWRYVENFFREYAFPDSTGLGESEYVAAEEHARAALTLAPGHLGATRLLATLLGDKARWEEMEAPARAAIRAFRRAPDGYRILALAAARRGRDSEAAALFDSALARMDSVQRWPYENLSVLLRRAGAARYDSLNPAQRAELRQLYWAVAQPLALDSVNRALVEFYARTTYVDLRWTAPEEEVNGWETDRGLTYIRYGPPDLWASFAPLPFGAELESNEESMPLRGGQVTTVWAYRRSHARFIFQNQRGYTNARYASEFPMFAREIHEASPVSFDNVPGLATMDTVLAQLAQFRGDRGGTTLAVFGFVPVGRMFGGVELQWVPIEVAAFVKDARMRDVARRVAVQTVALGDGGQLATQTWRFELFPSEQYLLRLEARQQAAERSARAIMGLDLRRFGPGPLALSDLVVADRVAPRDSAPRRWTDFLIDPSVGRIRRGEPVAFLWELYNLSADSAGVGRYRVELAIYARSLERRGFGARIIGGVADAVGLSARGDSIATIGFEREAPVRGRTAIPEYLQVELGDAPEGTYGVSLTVTDLVSGQQATTRRQFVVTTTPEDVPRRPQD